ncbi:hypothetical protein B0H10DRAFT_714084 [Mycena sp. CBHHK59/15]|nr:hypothetical protein B0H10DRAFT_714084 [Mycena sp. CBHHK59/15]
MLHTSVERLRALGRTPPPYSEACAGVQAFPVFIVLLVSPVSRSCAPRASAPIELRPSPQHAARALQHNPHAHAHHEHFSPYGHAYNCPGAGGDALYKQDTHVRLIPESFHSHLTTPRALDSARVWRPRALSRRRGARLPHVWVRRRLRVRGLLTATARSPNNPNATILSTTHFAAGVGTPRAVPPAPAPAPAGRHRTFDTYSIFTSTYLHTSILHIHSSVHRLHSHLCIVPRLFSSYRS